jgi:hypothetical protein
VLLTLTHSPGGLHSKNVLWPCHQDREGTLRPTHSLLRSREAPGSDQEKPKEIDHHVCHCVVEAEPLLRLQRLEAGLGRSPSPRTASEPPPAARRTPPPIRRRRLRRGRRPRAGACGTASSAWSQGGKLLSDFLPHSPLGANSRKGFSEIYEPRLVNVSPLNQAF